MSKKIFVGVFFVFCFLYASEDFLEDDPILLKQQPQTKEKKKILKLPIDLEKTSKRGIGEASTKNKPRPQLDKNVDMVDLFKKNEEKRSGMNLVNKDWIHSVAVISTTFVNGDFRRGYGTLLKNGMYVTSFNTVYDGKIYPKYSYAMMQDDSSPGLMCVAKLSLKAVDSTRGIAILETVEYTDMYCNARARSSYHKRIYDDNWIDIFKDVNIDAKIVYYPFLTPSNMLVIQNETLASGEPILSKKEKEDRDFQEYEYGYGKGYFDSNGELMGILGSKDGTSPVFVSREDIQGLLCELDSKNIIRSNYIRITCNAMARYSKISRR